MSSRIRNLQDVVDYGLCIGCGACYYGCDRDNVSLWNVESAGIRPRFEADCADCSKCLSFCPGYHVDGELVAGAHQSGRLGDDEYGPVLEIWEGHAADPEVRHQAGSGGAVTALAIYCLEHEGMEMAIHAGMDEEKPWTNRTFASRSRAELLSRTGSRYAPASPCDGLGAIAEASAPCVFIGKPCDATGAMNLRRERPDLDRNLGLVLTFFCAGTPSTAGTLKLLDSLGIGTGEIDALRYRGEGWPGNFKVLYDDRRKEKAYTYKEAWGRLSPFKSFRCNICPDSVGQVADISCGDAWHRFDAPDKNEGLSLVLVRTERGREILQRAVAAGYLKLKPVGAREVLDAQPNLLKKREWLWGRLLGMRLGGMPLPRYERFPLLRAWLGSPVKEQARSVLGTLRRVVQRRYYKRTPLDFAGADRVKAPAVAPAETSVGHLEEERVAADA